MKSQWLLWLAWLGTVPVFGQGQIGFVNRSQVAGIDAPVFDVDCVTRLEGAAYLAQVYAGLAPDSLRPVGIVQPFRTGTAAGYIPGIVITVPGALGGTVVYAQLRAWEARAGRSYEAAVAAGGKYGFSNIVPIVAVMAPGTPNDPVGLQSFCLVPEPGPGTLLALGGGLWLLAARRRRPCGP
jgi:hypothetical protein